MKKLLTEKNLMWAAIVYLAVLHLCPALGVGESKSCPNAMRQRTNHMSHMSQMGSRGDTARGEWTGPRVRGRNAKGDKKKSKDSE